jgi:hypothetical protein
MRTGSTAMPQSLSAARSPGFFRNLLYWLLDLDDATALEQGRRRLRAAPGFFATLPPGALAYARSYRGPENHGPRLSA